jgi:hypothetical protein
VGFGVMPFATPIRRLPVPASVAELDLALVARVLVKHRANVSAAARELSVPSHDLRKLTWSHPRLIEVALEEAHQLVDKAESKLRAALDGDHPDRALAAATFILSHHRAARERGWNRHGGGYDMDPPPGAAPTVVIWAGDSLGYRPPLPAAPEEHARQVSASASPALSADSAEADARVH